jgi:outer membrane protein
MKQRTRTISALASATFAGLVLTASPAIGQEAGSSSSNSSDGWIVTIGAGPQVYPKFPGASDYGLYPMPIVGLRRSGRPMAFTAPDQGFGFGFLSPNSGFDFGPVLRFQSKRQESDVGAPVGNVPFTVEAGAYAQLWLGSNLRLRVDARRGIGGHKGWIGDAGADWVIRDGDRYIFSIGPRVRFANNRYQDAYFAVTPAAAAASGLPAYNPGGGIEAVGVTSGLTYRFASSWGLYGYAGYDRLTGDAARSPIVRTLGSRNQFSGGIGLFYEFGLGTHH